MLAREAAAVHAFFIGRILLMGRDLDTVERAEILVAAVMLTVAYRTADTMIRVVIFKHTFHLKDICRCRHNYSLQIYALYAP